MEENARNTENNVTVRAYSPDAHPILVLELDDESLCVAYYETGYDLRRIKPVTGEWLKDNAIGRHSFSEVNPPRNLEANGLKDYVEDELRS